MDHWICALPGRCRVVDGVVLLLLMLLSLVVVVYCASHATFTFSCAPISALL